MPEISPETGITYEYNNAFSRFSYGVANANFWDTDVVEDLKQLREEGEEMLVQRYSDRYLPSVYKHENLADEDVKKKIARLDAIADEINALFASEQYDRTKYSLLYTEAFGLIYGKNNKDYLAMLKNLEDALKEKWRLITSSGNKFKYHEMVVALAGKIKQKYPEDYGSYSLYHLIAYSRAFDDPSIVTTNFDFEGDCSVAKFILRCFDDENVREKKKANPQNRR